MIKVDNIFYKINSRLNMVFLISTPWAEIWIGRSNYFFVRIVLQQERCKSIQFFYHKSNGLVVFLLSQPSLVLTINQMHARF